MKPGSGLVAVFSVMALVLFSSAGVTYWMGVATIHRSQEVARQRGVIDSLKDTLSTLKDAETGQRGFLLTHDAKYLNPYHDAIARIHAEIQTLSAEATAGDLPRDEVAAIATITDTKLSELDQTLQLSQRQQNDAAMEIVRLGDGRRTMEMIRDRIANLNALEEKELAADRIFADRFTNLRSVLYAVVTLVNLGFLYWAFRRVRREMAGREAAAMEVSRQKELLAVTLASIGDAVIVADTGGRITFLNAVAEKLTGWTSSEAATKSCAEVFKIINESSRLPVQSPVEKVLQSGTIVGLANHTLLIRKDGSEIPIDDSGVPIRDAGGAVRGVVLIFRDFSEHKATENTLRQAKNELEAASKAKDQFLATLSHELRTPLTPVLATLTTWEASDELPEAFRDDVLMLRRNIALEARLIDDLLDLTRIVRGKLLLEMETVDAHDLLRSVTGMYRSEIHAKRVTLSLTLKAKNGYVQADPGRLQQVLWNILKNATKFTPEGGQIEVGTSDASDGKLCISFKDTGIGMSPEMMGRLFQPFEQGTEDMVRRSGGLGLGMAISKALVDVQGGSIAASSEGAHMGSTFTLCFPSVAAPTHSTASSRPQESSARPQSQPLRILLVEDHADTARVMARLLRRLGHTVQASETVAGALELSRNDHYDILLSDIGLPDGTGLDLIRQIRVNNDIPAIALTGFGMDDDIAQCKAAGFTAHLTKPVNFQRLEMVIQQVAAVKAG